MVKFSCRIGSPLFRILTAAILGLLMVFYPEDAGNYFVMVIGALFMIPSIISLATVVAAKGRGFTLPVLSVGSLLFGFWMIVSPDFFSTLLIYVLGFLLVIGGVVQLNMYMVSRALVRVSPFYYISSVLILLAGLVALFNPGGMQRTAFLIIGCTSLYYALQELVSWLLLKRRVDEIKVQMEAEQTAAQAAEAQKVSSSSSSSDDDIEDAEIIEISKE